MTITAQGVFAVYEDLQEIQEKTSQAARIKAELDTRREQLISSLDKEFDLETFSVLINVYSRENHFIDITKKGIENTKKLEVSINELIKYAGLVKNKRIGDRIRQGSFDKQAELILKSSFRAITDYLEYFTDNYEEFVKNFTQQVNVLKELQKNPDDKNGWKLFNELYNAEKKGIKKFYFSKVRNTYVKVIAKIGLKRSILLMGVINFPIAWFIQPWISYEYGMEWAAFYIPQLIALVKQVSVLLYVISKYYNLGDKLRTEYDFLIRNIKSSAQIKALLAEAIEP